MVSYDNLWNIMKEKGITQYALIKQYKALLSTEGIELEFADDAVDHLAQLACDGGFHLFYM